MSTFFTRKIYIADKPLILTNDAATYIREHALAAGFAHFTGAFPRHYRLAIEHLSRPRTLGAIIEDISTDSLLREIHKLYTPIDAAGGIVLNEDDALLMIFRRRKWDLPKGKVDDGEAIDTCALREVSEETGLKKLVLKELICQTYHTYSQHGQSLLKRTSWYRMRGTIKDELLPQREESIEEARWIAERDLHSFVYKSYDAIREVLCEAGLRW